MTAATRARAVAPLFRVQNIRATNVTLPVELILDIVRLAASSNARTARNMALVCRLIHAEVDGLRFRTLRWRYPDYCRSLTTLSQERGIRFLPENLRLLYWDWSHSKFSSTQQHALQRHLRWHVLNVPPLRLTTLALNIAITERLWTFVDASILTELMIIYDPFWNGRPADLRAPYHHLARLLLHNFPVDWWPEDAVFGCTSLTHLALDAVHSQDAVIAQDDADAIWCFTTDALEKLPLLQRFLFILRDDGDLPQFKNADIYADALRHNDARVRMDFDTIPCDWQSRWWRSRAQEGPDDVWSGMGFWNTGCAVPEHFRLARPPLSHFLLFPDCRY